LDTPESLLRVHVTPDEHDVVYDGGRPLNIWTRPLQGGRPRQLTFEKEGASFPVISRDGQWLAYEVNRGDDTQLAVMDRKSGQQRILTDRPGQNFCSGWTPDSRRVLCAGYFDGVWNIETIDRETGERNVITGYTAFGSFVRSPTWRPGTEQVAYEYMEVKGNIYLIDLARGR
jgi:Tol biopolymer transport system component